MRDPLLLTYVHLLQDASLVNSKMLLSFTVSAFVVFMSMFMSKLVQVNVQAIHQLRLTRCFIVITPRGATEVAISLCLASYCVCVPNVDLNTRPQTSRRRELHSADDPIPTPIQNLVVHFTFALSW